jgi:tetratricopeptide (TPR) repeat protein
MRLVSVRAVAALSILSAFAWCAAARLSAEPITGGDVGAKASVDVKNQEISDAVARFKDRDFDGALKLLKEAVKKNADLPPAQVILAQLFSQANIPMGVRNALEQAVIESPDDPETYVIMADIALRERQVTVASLLYAKAASLVEKFDKSTKRKGLLQPRVYSGLASVSEARDDFRHLDRGRQIKVAGSGLLGRALQHELDHLDGKLYIDYLDSMDELMAVGVGNEDDAEIREATSALA